MRKVIYSFLNLFSVFFRNIYSDRLRVLAYHTVPDDKKFERQLQYLKLYYNIIGIEDLKNFFEGRKILPPRALLITFDDGDISVFLKAFPLLEKYRFRSCLFIISSLIDTNKNVWIRNVENGELKKGNSYQEARKVVQNLKKVNNKQRVQLVRNYEETYTRQLTSKDLFLMEGKNMFIGNHSHTHPMFDKCTEKEIQEELRSSLRFFQDRNLEGYNIFAYPNGNEDVMSQKLLSEAGMKMIFLFDHQINSKNLNPLRISRIRVDTSTEIREFAAKVSGVHSFIHNLLK